jgi:hypothetical protein
VSIIINIDDTPSGVTIETNAANDNVVIDGGRTDNATSAALAALSLRINSVSAAGGSGSVTSTELSAAIAGEVSSRSAADSVLSAAITIVSNAISAETVNRTSAAADLSVKIATNSAQMTSADNRLSNTITNLTLDELAGVSTTGATDQQVLTFNSASGQWVASSIAAGSGSVTSTELSAGLAGVSAQAASIVSVVVDRVSGISTVVTGNSAQMTSADNAISNAVSIVSVAQAATSAAVTSVNNRVSGISSNVTSIAGRLDTVSALISTVASALSQSLSAKTISSLIGVSIAGATDQQVLTYNSADGKWHASTIVAGSGSVTSTELSAVSAAAASADASLSARVDTVSNAISAKTISSLIGVSIAGATDQQALVYNSADGKWHASTVGGTGSVTSTELSAGLAGVSAQAASIVSVLTDRVSTNSAQMTSADNAISNAVSLVSVAVVSVNNRISGISTTVTGNSAQMTSADNAISNAVSIVSVAQAATSAAVTSVNNRVSGISTTVTNNSAQMTSADNAISNAVSVETAARTSADNALSNAISAKTISSLIGVSITGATDGQALVYNSADGKWHASTAGGAGSVTSTELSAGLAGVSAQAASALSVVSAYVVKTVAKEYAGGNISTGSVVVDWANGNAQAFSILSAAAIAAPTNGSAGVTYLLRFQQDGTGSKQLTWNPVFKWQGSITPTLGGASAVDLLGLYYDGTNYYGRHDTLSVTVQGGSVTSTELSAVSAAAASADASLSTRIDTASAQVASIVNNYLSALGTTHMRYVSGAQGVSGTALTDISGLSLVLSAGGIYRVELFINHRMSVANTYGYGLSFPAMVHAGGRWMGPASVGGSAFESATTTRGGWFNEAASGSIVMSAVAGATTTFPIIMEGLFMASATGTLQVMARTSATGSPVSVLPGSHVRAYKLNG